MKRSLEFIFSLIGALLSFGVCLAVLRVWQGPCGNDIYYYALQTKALTLTGLQLFSDASPVYRVLFFINKAVNNPVLSVQILSSFSIAAIYFCFLAISFRRGPSLYKIAAAAIAVFNPAVFYLLLEFTKSSFALALFFIAWLLLTNKDNSVRFKFVSPPAMLRGLAGLLFLGLSAFSHRLMLALFLCFVIHTLAVFYKEHIARHTINLKIIIPAAIFSLVFGGAIFFFLRGMIADRFSLFSLSAPMHRMTQFVKGNLLLGEKIFYVFTQLAVFFFVPAIIIMRRQFLRSEVIFAALAWLFLFPFLQFSWDEIGFRLLILAPLLLAPWLISLKLKYSRAASIVFFAASIAFSAESVKNLSLVKGPDYRDYEKTFASIETQVSGRRLIAHRGLAGYLWYEKGIRSENFIPASDNEKYLRLVYAFSPDILNAYLEPDDPPPVQINRTYTLMEEYIWQRFYQERQDLRFLKSELNPFLPRPVSAFAINEAVSLKLSPGSDF